MSAQCDMYSDYSLYTYVRLRIIMMFRSYVYGRRSILYDYFEFVL